VILDVEKLAKSQANNGGRHHITNTSDKK
jgi:hypothetical protein